MNSYNAFVEPILDRPTLTVLKYARVIQILFKPGTNTVSGVKYERFGKIEEVYCSKEVVVSSGAVGSPKLLLLSGIGPAEDLRQLGVST